MTERMSREDFLSAAEKRRGYRSGAAYLLDDLRDLAKSRPIDLGGGVMVARLEQVGWYGGGEDWPSEPAYRIHKDQPDRRESE